MIQERRAAIFRNGRNQAVRIPKEFELPGKEALIRKEGPRLVIEAVTGKPNLLDILARMTPSSDPFPNIDDPLPEPVAL
jgi:antitoxin VapB